MFRQREARRWEGAGDSCVHSRRRGSPRRQPSSGIWYLGIDCGSRAECIGAFPAATVATDDLAFVVAERTPTEPAATWRVWNVKFGKPGR